MFKGCNDNIAQWQVFDMVISIIDVLSEIQMLTSLILQLMITRHWIHRDKDRSPSMMLWNLIV